MLLYLMILLTVVPLVELMILLQIARAIDWMPTIGLVILTGVLGAWLARREGFRVWRRIEADLSKGAVPAQAMLDGGLILLAGVVLITPGILTDLCGFALLIPPIRNRVRTRLVEAFKKRIVVLHSGPDDSFVDVTATSTEADQSRDEPAP